MTSPLPTNYVDAATPIGALTELPATTARGINAINAQINTNTTAIKSVAPYPVDAYGADPTGATFSDTAFAAAVTAMGTNPGVLALGAGTYKLATTKTLAYPGQGIRGQGAACTHINYTGTGDCLRIWHSTVPTNGLTPPGLAGPIYGISILGTNSSAGAVGLHIGDLYCINIQNVEIIGFDKTGSIGFWGENRYTWSERAYVAQLIVQSCTNCVVFEKNASHPASETSWDYGWFDMSVNPLPNQNGVILKNNVGILTARFSVVGNTVCASPNTGVFFTVGTTGSDISRLVAGNLNIQVESAGNTGVGQKEINVGAVAKLTSPNAQVSFENGGSIPFVAGTLSRYNSALAGRIHCQSLGFQTASQAHRQWGVFANNFGAGDGAGFTNFYLETGNQFYQRLPNGAQTVTFTFNAPMTGQAAAFDLILQQPASGSPCTLTWPGSVVWVGGSAPTLLTASNAIDYIRLLTTDFTTFYGVKV